jgi:ATP-binding cassette subfamily B multidrug efflux pump
VRPLEGRVRFDGVGFSYDGEQQVLQDVSFATRPGQMLALVGHTGSGKSTIISLLMGFYPWIGAASTSMITP